MTSGPTWTTSRLATKLKVLPDGIRPLPDDAPPLAEGEVDPLWDRLQARPETVLGGPARGWYPVVCPNEAEHTGGERGDGSTGYKPSAGGGIFRCLHGHCVELTSANLRDWLFAEEVPDLGAFGRDLADALGEADELEPDETTVHFTSATERAYAGGEDNPALRLARHIHRVDLWPGILPNPRLTAKGGVSGTQPITDANVGTVMTAIGMSARLNVMTWETEVTLAGYENKEVIDAHLSNLVHACTRCGMSGNPVPIWQAAERYSASKRYHPTLDWINACEGWDERDRIQELCDTLIMRDPKLNQWRDIVIRRWLLQGMYAMTNWQRINPVDVGYCLVLQGRQGRNKSKWVKNALLPPQFVTSDITLKLGGNNERDVVNRATTTPITELSELNATFGKSDIAGLRSFLTTLEDVYRQPWGMRPVKRARGTMYAATVNPRLFLVDVTGERRFWTLAIERCLWEHDIDLQQLWYQVAILYDKGEQYWLTDDEIALHKKISKEHQVDSDVHDIVNDLEARALAQPRDHTWVHVTAKELLDRMGIMPARSFAARQDLNALLDETDWAVEAKVNGKRGWWVPNTSVPMTKAQSANLRVVRAGDDEEE